MHGTTPGARAAASDLMKDDSFFLSEVNATATADQRDLESLALEMLGNDRVKAAWARAEEMFRILGGKYGAQAPEEAYRDIDRKMREWTYHYLLLSKVQWDKRFARIYSS